MGLAQNDWTSNGWICWLNLWSYAKNPTVSNEDSPIEPVDSMIFTGFLIWIDTRFMGFLESSYTLMMDVFLAEEPHQSVGLRIQWQKSTLKTPQNH